MVDRIQLLINGHQRKLRPTKLLSEDITEWRVDKMSFGQGNPRNSRYCSVIFVLPCSPKKPEGTFHQLQGTMNLTNDTCMHLQILRCVSISLALSIHGFYLVFLGHILVSISICSMDKCASQRELNLASYYPFLFPFPLPNMYMHWHVWMHPANSSAWAPAFSCTPIYTQKGGCMTYVCQWKWSSDRDGMQLKALR